MNIVCLVPPLNLPVNEYGHGYQPPLGLLSIAGALLDAAFQVELIDADAAHLSYKEIIDKLNNLNTDVLLVGHSGSIVANPSSLELITAIKNVFPSITILYGGIYATYAYYEIMSSEQGIDYIIAGEGEETTLLLLEALRSNKPDFNKIEGLVWRSTEGLVTKNASPPPIENLDQYRVAWELVNWDLYPGVHKPGRGAIVQFSRGCPFTCTYCGQWMFWKRWRHKSIQRFVDELELLCTKYDVHTIWIADENIGYDKQTFHSLLRAIRDRKLDLIIFCALTAEDVVRDKNDLKLYREAGIVCLMMGIESFDDAILKRVKKNNHFSVTHRAVLLLQKNNILSIVNVVFGIRNETWKSLLEIFQNLRQVSPNYFNALHFTPLSWTPEGRTVNPEHIIQQDQKKWDFRTPVVHPINFSPKTFAILIKLIEALFYLRPSWLFSALFQKDPEVRKIMFNSSLRLLRVYLDEWKRIFQVSFVKRGALALEKKQFGILMPGNHKSKGK